MLWLLLRCVFTALAPGWFVTNLPAHLLSHTHRPRVNCFFTHILVDIRTRVWHSVAQG